MSTKSHPQSSASGAPGADSSALVLAEVRGPVAVCTLNRPKALNALSEGLVGELLGHLERFDKDPTVRVLVLTGGPKVFAAGADIKEMAPRSAGEMSRLDPLARWDRFAALKKPLIAAVNGFALGGGCELAMACDIIIAGEDAWFGQPEILLGVMPGAGGTQRLVRRVGAGAALELLWTGARIPAARALELGLVHHRVPSSLTLDEALRIARAVAAQPPLAVQAIKASVHAGLDMDLGQGLKQERERFYSLFDTKDQKEGMAAFMEKRKASFSGK